jgi:uncharacterized RDD family membrane protein YckC
MARDQRANPYVGLRPFFAEDSLYFFGREQQTAELLEILHQHRFLGIVGSSGSGKSSLVRAGLVPSLLAGFLAQDRDRWRIVQMKPGDAPIGNLASALLKAMGEAVTPSARADFEQLICDEHTDAVVEFLSSRLEKNANVFLLVDQFEEIFAFRGNQEDDGPRSTDPARRKERARRKAEAADFVDLLMKLAERRDLPVYVALTMRTDFLGDCDLFYGFPEALNRGRYLVPRMTRQQVRDAIEGPAILMHASIAPRLLDHVLNALGDRFDRLPVLQHALLRTWDAWQRSGGLGPIDLQHFAEAGGLEGALNKDAEEGALRGLDVAVTGRIFKRLTDTDVSLRRVRSPARISELMAAAGAGSGMVEGVVRRFQEDGRSFVHLADDGKPDDPRVDISHESLIRQWDRLRHWVDEERVSRDHYLDLVRSAREHALGESALVQDPKLQLVLTWRKGAAPSGAWAERYSAPGDFELATKYLDESVTAKCRGQAEAELQRRWTKISRAALAVVVVAAVIMERTGAFNRMDGARASTAAVLATAVPMVDIGQLKWTTDDRGADVDWNAAVAYCENLTAADSLTVASGVDSAGALIDNWRLPGSEELLRIYDPTGVDTSKFKLKEPFLAGVSSNWLWSADKGVADSAFAVDFDDGARVHLPVGFNEGAHALCVSGSELAVGRAKPQDVARVIVKEGILDYYGLGIFVALCFVVAWAGKRIHRRIEYPIIERRFAATGGLNPIEVKPAVSDLKDAVIVHGTTYASTPRRVVGYGIDGLMLFAFAFVVLVVLSSGDPQVTVTPPSGDVVSGRLDSLGDRTVLLTTADGTQRTFGVKPQVDTIYEYMDSTATAPTESPAEGGAAGYRETIGNSTVHVTWPSSLELEGTIERQDENWVLTVDDSVRATLADTSVLSFPVSGVAVDVTYPPSESAWRTWLAICLIFSVLYGTLQIASRRQATLGMRAVRIFRTNLEGEPLSLARACVWYSYRVLSYLGLGLGFVVQPFSRRWQTLHDRMAGTVVLRRPSPGVTAATLTVGPKASSVSAGTIVVRVVAVIWYLFFLFGVLSIVAAA